jgi:hypothetical protein
VREGRPAVCNHGVSREKPAPGDRDGSAMQAANRGWSVTFRYIAAKTVPAVVVAALGAGVETVLTAVLRSFL